MTQFSGLPYATDASLGAVSVREASRVCTEDEKARAVRDRIRGARSGVSDTEALVKCPCPTAVCTIFDAYVRFNSDNNGSKAAWDTDILD